VYCLVSSARVISGKDEHWPVLTVDYSMFEP
jgi:hypothetical protein